MKATLPDGTWVEGTLQEVVEFLQLRTRGRPRRAIAKQLLSLLPATAAELVQATQAEPKRVYAALYHLRRKGRVEKGVNGKYYRRED